MPFEVIIIKLFSASDWLYFASQFFGEIYIYSAFVGVLLHKIAFHQAFRKTPIDKSFLYFVGVVFVSSFFINQSNLVAAVMNLRPLIRYVVLFYLIANLNFSAKQVESLVRTIIFIGVFEMFVGLLQLISGNALDVYLFPKESVLSLFGQTRHFSLIQKGRETGAIFGTLGDTIYYAHYLLFSLLVFLTNEKGKAATKAGFILASFVFIGYSFSRITFYAGILSLMFFYLYTHRLRRIVIISSVTLLILVAGILFSLTVQSSLSQVRLQDKTRSAISQELLDIFTKDFYERARGNRLESLLRIAPTILANNPLFGFGFDRDNAISQINTARPSFLSKYIGMWEKGYFNDVYWVALLAYSGLLGVGLFFYMLLSLGRFAWKTYRKLDLDVTTRDLGLVVSILTPITIIMLFSNQILNFRIFGFYFWFLSGLLVSMSANENRKLRRNTEKDHYYI